MRKTRTTSRSELNPRPLLTTCAHTGHNYIQLGTAEVTDHLILACSRCADVKRIPVSAPQLRAAS